MLPQRFQSRKVGLDRSFLRFARQPFAYDDDASGAIHDVTNVMRAEKLGLCFCSPPASQHEKFFVGEENAHLNELVRIRRIASRCRGGRARRWALDSVVAALLIRVSKA